MTEGNKRYLGDVVINEENYQRQREFFNDIIENWQGSRGGHFDAYGLWDERDGTVKLAADFATAEEGALARKSLQSDSVFIGENRRQPIINSIDPQHIYTDGVFVDDLNTDLMSIDWIENLDPNTLSDVLIAIDNKFAETNARFASKLDITDFDDFIDSRFNPLVESLDGVFETFTDEFGNTVTKLNAHLVNGIRFILTTQAKYDALPEVSKKYWRNFFIIKDPADIPPDYVDPMTWELTDGYIFEVRDGYLMVNNGLSNTWKPICSLETLLSGSNLNQIIYDYITDPDNEYIIPANNMEQSISLISPNTIDSSWRDYPFLSSNLHDDYVKNITMNNSSQNVSATVDSSGFKNVNLNINQVISDNVDSRFSNINTLIGNLNTLTSSLDDGLESLRARMSAAETLGTTHTNQIGDIGSTNIATQLSTLNKSIAGLRSDLTALSESVGGGIKYGDSDPTGGWHVYQDKNLRRKLDSGEYLYTKNYYNPKLALGMLYFTCHHYHKKADAGKWVAANKTAKKAKYNTSGDFVVALPSSSVAFVSYNYPNHCKIGIHSASDQSKKGLIYVNVDYTKDVDIDIIGHVLYRATSIRNPTNMVRLLNP